MLSVYLFCLVVGGAFAILSAFGDLFDSGAGAARDVRTDPDPRGADSGAVADAGDTGIHADVSHAAAIFSIRSLIYSLFAFGATGALLTWIEAGPGAPLTLGFAVLAGLLGGGGLGAFLSYVKRSDATHRGNVGELLDESPLEVAADRRDD